MNTLTKTVYQSPAKNTCYRCNKVGHWDNDCPENRDNRSPVLAPSSIYSDYPATHCRCGAGLCDIRVSRTKQNPNRKYYSCPGKYEKYCEYFKWCDKLKKEEILQVQPKPWPICGCGAGVCRVKTEENGISYFVCPIKKGYGACSFKQRMDNDVYEPPMVVDQEFFELSPEAEMLLDAVEMMFSPGFFLIEDHVQMGNGVNESSDVAHGMSAGTHKVHLHSVTNNISGNGVDKVLTTKTNDKLPNMGESQLENLGASVSTVVEAPKTPISRDESPSADSQNLDELFMKQPVLTDGQNEGSLVTDNILQSFEKLRLCQQKDFSKLLESVGPQNHGNMMKDHCTFASMDRLQVDYGLFQLRVMEYMKQAAELSCVEQAFKDDSYSRELLNRYKNEKSRFEEITRAFCEAGKAYTTSNEQLISLRGKAACVRAILAELEEELSCCKVENAVHKESLFQITKTMSKCKESMQTAYEEAGHALKQFEKREIERGVVKATSELQN